jgi:hypothetical protein
LCRRDGEGSGATEDGQKQFAHEDPLVWAN